MSKSNIITWIILLILTVVAGLISNSAIRYLVPIILIFAVLKFIGVAFNFMEMNKANIAWKIILIGYLCVFITLILVIKL